ncbi:hypothetical protein F5Y19DRAFT_476948 [Xylariaceae sp. FL1651]|nr:hypothetical protein F5Y19DRAFT_476948 [Xylariaceae sp. FL1651]
MATNREIEIQNAARDILTVFGQPEYFRLDGVIASGAHGVTIKVTELRPAGTPMPMLVGQKRKRARTLTPTEIAYALRAALSSITRTVGHRGRAPRNQGVSDGAVAGSMHIVRALAYRDGPNIIPRNGILDGLGSPVIGPVLAMEHLENQSFLNLVLRLKARPGPIPNRVIWSIYLCAIRAVTALAYPTAYNPEEPQCLEQTRDPNVNPSRLIHGDIHMDNIMFDVEDPSVREHRFVPIMKLIDFGRCKEVDNAVNENLYYMTEVYNPYFLTRSAAYRYEIRPATLVAPAEYKTIQTWAVLLSDEVESNVHLDTELRNLICRSMATNQEDRPSLQEVLFQVSQAAISKTAGSFLLYQTPETDEDIQNFLQETIYNALAYGSPLPSEDLQPQLGSLVPAVEVISL